MDVLATAEDIKETHFENQLLSNIGIEVMSLNRLRSKLSTYKLSKPERIDFYIMIYVTAGTGLHTVDFVQQPLERGSLVVVRPGQVQQWQSDGNYSAYLLLIDPAALPYWGELSSIREKDVLTLLDWETFTKPPRGLSTDIYQGLRRLSKDLMNFDETELEVSLIRHEFFALMLRIAPWQQTLISSKGIRTHHLATYRLFLKQLETSFRTEHSLKFYTKRLGYSASTISRASLASEGRTAKVVIDRRVALEAQRMLAHSTLSVSEVSHKLGFSESTNFVKFFKRITGMTPVKFRNDRSVSG